MCTEQVLSLRNDEHFNVTDPLIPKDFSHPRGKMLSENWCFEGSWVRQWRINRCLERNLSLAFSWFLWPVLFSQLPCACCCPVSFPTCLLYLSTSHSSSWRLCCLQLNEHHFSKLTSENKIPLPGTNLSEQSTVVILESQEKTYLLIFIFLSSML